MSFRIFAPVALVLSSLAVSGCATSYGQQISADRVAQIQKGVTTRAEITEWFGQPMQSVMMPDGGRTLYFVYYRQTAGGFYGQVARTAVGKGTAQTGTNLSVVIDKDGIVRDFEYSPGSGQ